MVIMRDRGVGTAWARRLLLASVGALVITGCVPPPDAEVVPGGSQTQPQETAAAAPITTPGPTADGHTFRMDFDSDNPMLTEPVGALSATEHTNNGGSLQRVDSYPGGGRALKFPAFAEGTDAKRAGIIVTASTDHLPNPGNADFSFGADVRLDPWPASRSTATARQSSAPTTDPGSEIGDNGDNVIQRGLASEPTQFKLQADNGRPSCSVTGSAGSVEVKGVALEHGVWYRLRCDRTGDALRLTVSDLRSGVAASYEADGSVGSIDFAPETPLSIGHKVTPEGRLFRSQPDQFNGTMDAVWIDIDRPR